VWLSFLSFADRAGNWLNLNILSGTYIRHKMEYNLRARKLKAEGILRNMYNFGIRYAAPGLIEH
jgi:hypothetical protein